MNTPEVDGVVVNYRTADDLWRFVDSWIAHTPDGARLTIANVDPLDLDERVGEEAGRHPGIRHMPFDSNVGYAHAANAALADTAAPVVAVFNADVELSAGAVERCAATVAGCEHVGVLGPRQVDDRGRITHAGIFGPPHAPKHRAWRSPGGDSYRDVRDDAFMVSGSAMFARAGVWRELAECRTYRDHQPHALGPLLETPLYFEDTWLCQHARAHGYACRYDGTVTVVHRWHRSVTRNKIDSARVFRDSRDLYRSACDAHAIAHE